MLKKAKISEDTVMLPHHTYAWYEAVDDNEIAEGRNIRMKRITTDVLLCGPTTMEQVKAGINDTQDTLLLEIDLPKIFVMSVLLMLLV